MRYSPLLCRLRQAVCGILLLTTLISYSKADIVRANVAINRESLEGTEFSSGFEHYVEISVDTNGELASFELPERLQIEEATVLRQGEEEGEESLDVTCFFYWERDTSHGFLVSNVFRMHKPFNGWRHLTKDLYTHQVLCYHDAADRANGNTFTLFIENAQGQNEFVRLQVDDSQTSAALDLRTTHPDLCAGTQVFVVGFPTHRERPRRRFQRFRQFNDQPHCRTVLRSPKSPELEYQTMATGEFNSWIPPTTLADQIICYRQRSDMYDNRDDFGP